MDSGTRTETLIEDGSPPRLGNDILKREEVALLQLVRITSEVFRSKMGVHRKLHWRRGRLDGLRQGRRAHDCPIHDWIAAIGIQSRRNLRIYVFARELKSQRNGCRKKLSRRVKLPASRFHLEVLNLLQFRILCIILGLPFGIRMREVTVVNGLGRSRWPHNTASSSSSPTSHRASRRPPVPNRFFRSVL